MMVGFIHYTFSDTEQQTDMPTFIVPDELKAQVEQIRRFREEQRKAKAEAESKSGEQ